MQFAFFFSLDNDASCNPASPYAPAAGSTGAQNPGKIAGASTTYQQSQLRWVLLGILPGSVLLLGWLVWLARRK